MFTKEYTDTPSKEKIEVINYQPGLQTSGDLEAGTKTVNAVSEASGVGNADYSIALTLPKPSDARLIVKRICARLQATIDNIPSGDTNLYCRVYVDQQDADHRLFDMDWNTAGDKITAVDVHPDALSTVYDLLKDGSSHTFYIFFWKAGTGTGITLSLVQLWEGVGSCSDVEPFPVMDINHEGFMSMCGYISRVGTGTPVFRLLSIASIWFELYVTSGVDQHISLPFVLVKNNALSVKGTINMDLNYIPWLEIILN